MSIPKKGSRKIVVDGSEYVWLIRSKPTYTQDFQEGEMRAAIELSEGKGTTLIVSFPYARPDASLKSKIFSVTPKVIESCIKQAIKQGWEPNQQGAAFEFKYHE